jgi:membrane fusion protein (multidrug efflux system)
MNHAHGSTFHHDMSKCLSLVPCLLLLLPACKQQPPVSPPLVPTVVARPALRTDAARELRLSGSLAAEKSTTVSFATVGTVEQILVEEGASVRRGQVLARLSPRTYQDALGIAKAKADQAEDAYRRLEPMHRNKTLPEVKMVEVETGRQQARLVLSMAQKNLEDTVLRAREAGVVARRHVESGANVAPGMPVLTLVQTKTMLATAPLPETQVAKVKKGDAAKVTVPAIKKTFDGVVREIAVVADPLTRTYEIKVALPNPSRGWNRALPGEVHRGRVGEPFEGFPEDAQLRVGMVVEVRVHVPGDAPATVVPPEAVRVDETGAPSVFVVTKDNKLERRQVNVVGYVGESTAIAKGVAEGELVVTSGTPMLAHGMTVRLATARTAQP